MIIWKRTSHPNILPFLGASMRGSPNQLWVVLPWMKNVELRKFVKKHPGVNRFSLVSYDSCLAACPDDFS
jgi:serine/threonine protein kinase